MIPVSVSYSNILSRIQNTKDLASLEQLESLFSALIGVSATDCGYPENIEDVTADLDDSDFEQQLSEADIQEDSDDLEDDFDFEDDYEDSIRKTDLGRVITSMNDTRKNRNGDDLLRDELRDLIPLWRSGALKDGDGANRRFKSRAKGYDLYDSDDGFMVASSVGGKKNKKHHGGDFEVFMDINRYADVLDCTWYHPTSARCGGVLFYPQTF